MPPDSTLGKSHLKPNISKHYKSIWLILLYSLVLGTIAFGISSLPVFQDIEHRTQDLRFQLAPMPAKADTNIILVAIDQGSLDNARSLGQGWPFPRSFYALVTYYLNQAAPKAILYDILFDEHDFYRGDEDGDFMDAAFAGAMKRGGRTALIMTLSSEPSDPDPALERFASDVPAAGLPLYQGAETPIPIFLDSAAGVGGASLAAQRESILRSIPLYYNLSGKTYPNAGIAAYQIANPGKQIPLPDTPGNDFPLRWYGKGGGGGVFRYIPFSVLLHAAVSDMQGVPGSINPELFKGKYVIIGATASGLMDLKSSPYTWAVPGMEVWATFLSNITNRHFLTSPSNLMIWLFCIEVAFMILLVVLRTGSGTSLILVLILLILLSISSQFLFARLMYMLNYTSLLISLILSWLAGLTLSYAMEGKHRRELRQIFNRYLHPDLVDRIVKNPELVDIGGEELAVTVMFSDIYNFTGFSERHSPQELVSYLNEYFGSFTNAILDFGGLLDKYTGDGLMAVFGAPIARADHALSACRAALAHRERSKAFAEKENPTPAEFFHLNTRLGINSGRVVSGNIGSLRRMEYTSIGDAVNLAARLEGVNKVFKTHIIISESTYLDVKDEMLCRELDILRVKGKQEGTRIYELLGELQHIDPSQYTWLDTYAAALAEYRLGNFQEAATAFETLLPDPPSEAMHARCLRLMQSPPSTWDGIYTLEEK